MQESFFDIVLEVLKQDERFFAEDGSLMRNAVYEAAMQADERLIELLLSNPTTQNRFFKRVGDVVVFDKIEFGWVVNNRAFLPDSYTRFKNKIGLADSSGRLISQNNNVELVFPYKDCVLEGGQTKEDQKRQEVFYNETLAPDEVDRLLAPKVLTGAKRYTPQGVEDASVFRNNDNLIIKGNNLLALGSLLSSYEGRVNLIYIDPPFNTGNDSFNYNDRFTRATWLTFMKDRLALARRLLCDSGNIFIHIDINQSHYLKVLADEVFGPDNFVEEIIWAYGSPSGGRAATPKPVNVHDYILHYAKRYSARKQNRVYVPYSEKYIKDWFKYDDGDGRLYQRRQRGKDENGNAIWAKQYLDESKGVPLSTVWSDIAGEFDGVPFEDVCASCSLLTAFVNETRGIPLTSVWSDIQQVYADPRAYKEGNKADVEVIKEFSGGQKPERLISRIIEMASDPGDIVLDFHLGTGTTAATAHKMNRRYFGVEQLDSQIDICIRRLNKVISGETAGISKTVGWQGGGSFVYCELDKLNQQYVEEIEDASTTKQLLDIYERMMSSGYVSVKLNPKAFDENIDDFQQLSIDNQKLFLMELLDKNLLYVNYSDMEDEELEVSDADKVFTRSFYEGE